MELLGYITDDEDFLELVDIVRHPRRQRVVRHRINHFEEWDDDNFKNRFRVSKAVHRITDLIGDNIASHTNRYENKHVSSP